MNKKTQETSGFPAILGSAWVVKSVECMRLNTSMNKVQIAVRIQLAPDLYIISHCNFKGNVCNQHKDHSLCVNLTMVPAQMNKCVSRHVISPNIGIKTSDRDNIIDCLNWLNPGKFVQHEVKSARLQKAAT